MTNSSNTTVSEKARKIFRRHGGMLRTKEALRAGIHPRTLYQLRDAGEIEALSRGLYRLVDAPPLSHPDLVTVALKVPNGVLCLISALAYHDLTTQIPHEVYLALKRGSEPPRLDYPPIRIFWFSGDAFRVGIQIDQLDGADIRVYNREKTIADCFKYRHKIGLDTAIEALRRYREQGAINLDGLMEYAEICRVTKVMRPYLEAIL